MDSVTAFPNQTIELINAGLPAIVDLARGPWLETARIDRENQGLKNRNKIRVKRTVDEDVVRRRLSSRQAYFFLPITLKK